MISEKNKNTSIQKIQHLHHRFQIKQFGSMEMCTVVREKFTSQKYNAIVSQGEY